MLQGSRFEAPLLQGSHRSGQRVGPLSASQENCLDCRRQFDSWLTAVMQWETLAC